MCTIGVHVAKRVLIYREETILTERIPLKIQYLSSIMSEAKVDHTFMSFCTSLRRRESCEKLLPVLTSPSGHSLRGISSHLHFSPRTCSPASRESSYHSRHRDLNQQWKTRRHSQITISHFHCLKLDSFQYRSLHDTPPAVRLLDWWLLQRCDFPPLFQLLSAGGIPQRRRSSTARRQWTRRLQSSPNPSPHVQHPYPHTAGPLTDILPSDNRSFH